MEVPIKDTRFDQFTLEQRVLLNLNIYEPVNAIVKNSLESKTTPLNTITLMVDTNTLQINEILWSHLNGIEIREKEGSIAATLPTVPLIDNIVILNYDKLGQYVSTHSEIERGIN